MPNQKEPDIWQNMWREFSGGRLWLDRAVVLVYAALTGLCVVAFAFLTHWAFDAFTWLYRRWPWLLWLWTPLVTVAVAWVTRRWFPTLAGSGIPQVMVALESDLSMPQRTRFVALRLSIAKILLASAGLLGGLSIGREGPSVQVAAGIMLHARRWLRKGSEMDVHALLVAGGAAGLAAAFNAPLAGVVFALEELGHKLPPRNSGLIIAAIVTAGVVGISFFGNDSFLGHLYVTTMHWGMLWPGICVTVICGVLGGLFARVMVASITGVASPLNQLRKRYPLQFAAALGLLLAGMGLATGGATFGGGAESVRAMLEGKADFSPVFVPLKLISTWVTSWAGVPGGVFAPSLSVGAGVGQDVAGWFHDPALRAPLIALGMAAFLAAVTQTPLTAFIIVMEMVDGGAMVLSLMTAAMLSSLIARLIAKPLYASLAGHMLGNLLAAQAAAEAVNKAVNTPQASAADTVVAPAAAPAPTVAEEAAAPASQAAPIEEVEEAASAAQITPEQSTPAAQAQLPKP